MSSQHSHVELMFALTRGIVGCSGIRVGVTGSYVAFALLKQRWMIGDPATGGSHPSHLGNC